MYAEASGIWLQRDPLNYIDTVNLYSFVDLHPISRRDPFGESWKIALAMCLVSGLSLAIASLVSDILNGNLDICRTSARAICYGVLGCIGGCILYTTPRTLSSVMGVLGKHLAEETLERLWQGKGRIWRARIAKIIVGIQFMILSAVNFSSLICDKFADFWCNCVPQLMKKPLAIILPPNGIPVTCGIR